SHFCNGVGKDALGDAAQFGGGGSRQMAPAGFDSRAGRDGGRVQSEIDHNIESPQKYWSGFCRGLAGWWRLLSTERRSSREPAARAASIARRGAAAVCRGTRQ